MNSSRMCTAYCSGRLMGGEVFTQGVTCLWGVCLGRVSVKDGVSAWGGVFAQGGVCLGGV